MTIDASQGERTVGRDLTWWYQSPTVRSNAVYSFHDFEFHPRFVEVGKLLVREMILDQKTKCFVGGGTDEQRLQAIHTIRVIAWATNDIGRRKDVSARNALNPARRKIVECLFLALRVRDRRTSNSLVVIGVLDHKILERPALIRISRSSRDDFQDSTVPVSMSTLNARARLLSSWNSSVLTLRMASASSSTALTTL